MALPQAVSGLQQVYVWAGDSPPTAPTLTSVPARRARAGTGSLHGSRVPRVVVVAVVHAVRVVQLIINAEPSSLSRAFVSPCIRRRHAAPRVIPGVCSGPTMKDMRQEGGPDVRKGTGSTTKSSSISCIV